MKIFVFILLTCFTVNVQASLGLVAFNETQNLKQQVKQLSSDEYKLESGLQTCMAVCLGADLKHSKARCETQCGYFVQWFLENRKR